MVGRKGNVGSVFWIDYDFYPIDTTYFVTSKFPITYCYYLLKNQSFINGDSVVPGLSRDQAYKIKIAVPNEELLVKFDRLINSLRLKIKNNTSQIQTLSTLRDALLPKLMKGEIRVKMSEL